MLKSHGVKGLAASCLWPCVQRPSWASWWDREVDGPVDRLVHRLDCSCTEGQEHWAALEGGEKHQAWCTVFEQRLLDCWLQSSLLKSYSSERCMARKGQKLTLPHFTLSVSALTGLQKQFVEENPTLAQKGLLFRLQLFRMTAWIHLLVHARNCMYYLHYSYV